jgi:hypothetical protein
VYVLLGGGTSQANQSPNTGVPADRTDALIATLEGQIEDLREQVRSERQAHAEARRLLAAALERIPPQLEAPSEPRESPESPGPTETSTEGSGGPQRAAEEPERTEPLSATPGPQERVSRPWWRRVFGGGCA